MFIVIEGGDGTGKTFQLKMLKEYLEEIGRKVHITREPGGVETAEKIRALVLYTDFQAKTQALLFAAARHEHLHHVIKPKMKEGIDILCDRYLLSSMVYQGLQGVPEELMLSLHKSFNDNIFPDYTILLDAPVDITMQRLKQRHQELGEQETVFDEEGKYFHDHVRQRFLDWAKRYPSKTKIIDASKSPDTVHKDIIKSIEKFLR